jgi:hypothetical protein
MLLNQVQQPETSMGKNEKKTNAGKQGKAAVVEAEEIEQNPGRLTFVLLILGFPWLKHYWITTQIVPSTFFLN